MSNKPNNQDPLRANADIQLAQAPSTDAPARSTEELLHDLHVHQIELEMQNETLRQSQISLEESRDRWVDFYDFAPVGYLTLSREALISDINLTGATLLGEERSRLVSRRFARFVSPEDRDHWHQHFMTVLRHDRKQTCELAILRSDGVRLHAQLDSMRLVKDSDTCEVRVVLSDITKRRQVEEALRISAEEFRDIYTHAPCGYHSLDKDGFICRINDTELEWLGYTRDEVIGKFKWSDLVTPASQQTFRDNYPRFLNQGFIHDLEFEIIRKDGTIFIGLVNATAIYDLNSDFLISRSTVFDITARKQLESALRESERRRYLLEQQEIVQTSLDGFWIVNARNGQILNVNDRYCEMVGFSREEVMAMGIKELDSIETPEITEARIRKILETGHDRFETRHRHKLGHLIDFEVNVSNSEIDGGRNFAFFHDITERKRAEENVRQSRNQMRTFIEQAPISAAMFDLGMNYLAVSGRWMDEYSRGYADLIGLNHYVVHPDMPDKWKTIHQQALVGATLENNDDMWIQDDGSKHWLRWAALPWIDENKGIGGIIISAENITDSKRLEIELATRRNEMDNLQKLHIAAQTASAIAHEINQPLLAIASYNQAALMLMKAEKPNLEKICKAVEGSEKQAHRAGQSIRELLEFLSVKEFPTETIDLKQEIMGIMNAAKSEHELHFHAVLRLEDELPLVRVNRIHVQKVLFNLLRNGIDAMREAGVPLPTITVTVCAMKDGSTAQVTIQDNGPGVKKEVIQRLFDPFFTTKTKGIGMGLAISRSLIEENGGQLWVDPQEGTGAIFHLTLPFAT